MTPEIQKLIEDGRWQPIEEAPRDGTNILATDAITETWVVYWSEKRQRFIAYSCGDEYFDVTFYAEELSCFRPLPDNRLADALEVMIKAAERIINPTDSTYGSAEFIMREAIKEVGKIAEGKAE